MNIIKKKIVIGLLFSIIAILVQVFVKYATNSLESILSNLSSIGINFVIFFLIGYVILGNLLAAKNK